MFQNEYELSQKMSELKKLNLKLNIEHWYNYELYKWQWWMKFIYLIIPIIVFYKLLDRKRIYEIITYGLLVTIFSTVIDVYGVYYGLWNYEIRLIPGGFFQIHDLFFIPIVSALTFQYFSRWKPFIIANLILSAIGAYVKEPIFQWIHIYKAINWNHTYSFILFFLMVLVCRYITEKIKAIHLKNLN